MLVEVGVTVRLLVKQLQGDTFCVIDIALLVQALVPNFGVTVWVTVLAVEGLAGTCPLSSYL